MQVKFLVFIYSRHGVFSVKHSVTLKFNKGEIILTIIDMVLIMSDMRVYSFLSKCLQIICIIVIGSVFIFNFLYIVLSFLYE